MGNLSNTPKRLDFFERYLSLWVLLCMVGGLGLGKLLPDFTTRLAHWEFGQDSHVNVPIAVLIWLMIYPMMLKIDFGGLRGVAKKPKGLLVTLFVNWLVKPFSMALLGWVFMQWLFSSVLGWIEPETAKNYTAGLIILAAAPCTAMVFVWSYLTDGDGLHARAGGGERPHHALRLRAHRDVPRRRERRGRARRRADHVRRGLHRHSAGGRLAQPHRAHPQSRGKDWFEHKFLPKFQPVTIVALLATLVLIFAFQAENITTQLDGRAAAGGADSHPGLFQLRPDLRADAPVQSAAQRRLARRAHRREQLL